MAGAEVVHLAQHRPRIERGKLGMNKRWYSPGDTELNQGPGASSGMLR